MKNSLFHFPANTRINAFSVLFLIAMTVWACHPEKSSDTNEIDTNEEDIVKIITNVMDFEMTDSLDAGWHTFHYENKSSEPHFFLIEKYPEGKTLEDGKKEIVVHFQNGMNKIMEGKGEESGAEFAKLPQWYGDVQFYGGSGIISPGGTSVTTLKLSPGYYVFECYMKMKGGIFHSAMGMVKDLVVVNNENEIGESPISPDIELSISSTDGIILPESIHAGELSFKVTFKDQVVHENFVGHDINLAKLDENANLEELEAWMNWAVPGGLLEQAPAGVTFLGGVNDMPAGGNGYFTANLESGAKYVLISEVPNTKNKNMLKVFTVGE